MIRDYNLVKIIKLLSSTALSVLLIPTAFASGNIPGWPNYLAMGTVTNNATSVGNALVKTPVDAIFKYAGNDGAGDQGQITDLTTEKNTVAQARYIESNSADHHKVMPVLVVYTIDLSGGMVTDDVTNDTYLLDHYINLINYCAYLESQKDDLHPHPATLIINPDFLGMMQQNSSWSPLQADTLINVNQQLKTALNQAGVKIQPPNFQNNLLGYIQSINWIIRAISPDVPFGWQENIWATGSASWIFTATNEQVISQQANPTLNYVNSLGVYQGSYKPDFFVFDRYERDDFYLNNTQWFYNRNDWKNYLTYVNNISQGLNTPALLWQIPGGHMLTKNDNSTLTLDHVATAPDFFFGDVNIGQNFQATLLSSVLNFQVLAPQNETAMVHLSQDTDQNWTQSELQTAVNDNIVAILWGGGSTTGVAPIGTNGDDGGWLANKVENYYKNPVPLPNK